MKNTSMRNVRSTPESMSHLAKLFPHPGDADEYQPPPWFCPSARQRFHYRVMEGLLVIRPQSMSGNKAPSQRSVRRHSNRRLLNTLATVPVVRSNDPDLPG